MSSPQQPNHLVERVERMLAAVQQGDQSQLGVLLDLYRGYLFTVAAERLDQNVATKVAPSDVVQESLLQASQGFKQFRGSTEIELRRWLGQILNRNLIDAHRYYTKSARRDVSREVSLDDNREGIFKCFDITSTGPSPSGTAVLEENFGRLLEMLKYLSEEQRLAIQMRSFEQRGFDEIGKRIGKSEAAARKVWARAVEELTEQLRIDEK